MHVFTTHKASDKWILEGHWEDSNYLECQGFWYYFSEYLSLWKQPHSGKPLPQKLKCFRFNFSKERQFWDPGLSSGFLIPSNTSHQGELAVTCFVLSVTFGPRQTATRQKARLKSGKLKPISLLNQPGPHRRHHYCQRSWHKHPLWTQRLSSTFQFHEILQEQVLFIHSMWELTTTLRLWNCAS